MDKSKVSDLLKVDDLLEFDDVVECKDVAELNDFIRRYLAERNIVVPSERATRLYYALVSRWNERR